MQRGGLLALSLLTASVLLGEPVTATMR